MDGQSLWDNFVGGIDDTYQKLEAETISEFSNGIWSPIKDNISKFSSVLSSVGESQSDVKNLSGFTDYIKKYIWVIPVVIIVLMVVAKKLFTKKGGR
ncbi:MAG: hypothetical protein PHN88_16200 [Ignavibacteria bacterium]|nr:hypothetical protein [Ignavibacteria bacterium]